MIEAFYIENRKKLVNFIKGYAGDYEVAEDVVQEVFLRVMEGWPKPNRTKWPKPRCRVKMAK